MCAFYYFYREIQITEKDSMILIVVGNIMVNNIKANLWKER
jgi:hypothetical protein